MGRTVTIDCDGVTEICLLDSSAFRKITLNLTRQDPLITNCLGFLFTINNVIMFKNHDYRDVAIGVHNYKNLVSCLKETASTEITVSTQKDIPFTSRGSNDYNYFVNMPVKSHIECYLKFFYLTILTPLLMTVFFYLAFSYHFGPIVSIILSVFPFLIISMKFYAYDIVTLKMSETVKAIRVDCNSKYSDVIKYGYVKELHYLSSLEESKALFDNKDIRLIKTPHPYTLWENVIYIELQNGTIALLSVKNHKKLYKMLQKSLDENIPSAQEKADQ